MDGEADGLAWELRFYDPVVLPVLGLVAETDGPASEEVRRALGVGTSSTTWSSSPAAGSPPTTRPTSAPAWPAATPPRPATSRRSGPAPPAARSWSTSWPAPPPPAWSAPRPCWPAIARATRPCAQAVRAGQPPTPTPSARRCSPRSAAAPVGARRMSVAVTEGDPLLGQQRGSAAQGVPDRRGVARGDRAGPAAGAGQVDRAPAAGHPDGRADPGARPGHRYLPAGADDVRAGCPGVGAPGPARRRRHR